MRPLPELITNQPWRVVTARRTETPKLPSWVKHKSRTLIRGGNADARLLSLVAVHQGQIRPRVVGNSFDACEIGRLVRWTAAYGVEFSPLKALVEDIPNLVRLAHLIMLMGGEFDQPGELSDLLRRELATLPFAEQGRIHRARDVLAKGFREKDSAIVAAAILDGGQEELSWVGPLVTIRLNSIRGAMAPEPTPKSRAPRGARRRGQTRPAEPMPSRWGEVSDPSSMDIPWGTMSIERPPLYKVASHAGMGRTAPTDMGCALRRPDRYLIDRMVFTRPAIGTTIGRYGTLLVDVSGSMGLRSDDVRQLVEKVPMATIATYAGYSDNESGYLRIVAAEGKMTEYVLSPRHAGGNVVDGPALEWLMLQRAPRIWYSDGVVTGLNDQPTRPTVALARGMQDHGVRRVGGERRSAPTPKILRAMNDAQFTSTSRRTPYMTFFPLAC